MTILLEKSSLIFLSVPKCGSTWIAATLSEIGVARHTFEPGRFGHHHGVEEFRSGYSKFAAVIREPVSWYLSYWRYRQRTGWGKAPIDVLCQSPELDQFVANVLSRCPGYVTALYEEFLGQNFDVVQDIGHLAALPQFLVATLIKHSEIPSDFTLETLPKLNETDPSAATLDSHLAVKLIHSDQKVYDYFATRFLW